MSDVNNNRVRIGPNQYVHSAWGLPTLRPGERIVSIVQTGFGGGMAKPLCLVYSEIRPKRPWPCNPNRKKRFFSNNVRQRG